MNGHSTILSVLRRFAPWLFCVQSAPFSLGRLPCLPEAGLFFLAVIILFQGPGSIALAQTEDQQAVSGASSQRQGGVSAGSIKAPLPKPAVEQARAQREGDYGTLERPGMGGGQIQSAFDKSHPSDGVYEARDCRACVHKIRIRELMITTVILPAGAKIATVDIGDPAGFQVEIKGSNVLVLRPNGYGMDTSMMAHGEDGRVFPFYVRAEGLNSENIPDLVAIIHGAGISSGDVRKTSAAALDSETSLAGLGAPAPGIRTVAPSRARDGDDGDFVKDVEFDPATLHGWGDYRLWGSDELRPKVVFRDKRFTYLQYGERWDGLDLPVAYVVVDGIDELVNTRVQERTYIVESTAKLITLKSGLRHLCIEYAPDGGRTGPRNPYRAKAIVSSEMGFRDRRRGP